MLKLELKVSEWQRRLDFDGHSATITANIKAMPFYTVVSVMDSQFVNAKDEVIKQGVDNFRNGLLKLREELNLMDLGTASPAEEQSL